MQRVGNMLKQGKASAKSSASAAANQKQVKQAGEGL